jgi:SMI1 / KNR4 family (SUKH-1)
MHQYLHQIQRIKEKLSVAKKADKHFEVFGAYSHQYEINAPVTQKEVLAVEKTYSIELPDCYTAFITQVGNGGKANMNAAAGPFFGIYALGKNLHDLASTATEKYLKANCVIYPKMTDDDWAFLKAEKEPDVLYGGILPIGTQGCTYLHGLVLNGQFKGRIVNLDLDLNKPSFAYEENFLLWYERWLDEIISGELITEDPTWFGYNKGGSAEELFQSFLTSSDEDARRDNLAGILSKSKISAQLSDKIAQVVNQYLKNHSTLIEILCKSDYEKAKPYLLKLSGTDLFTTCKLIYCYAKDKSNEWVPILTQNANSITDEETFRVFSYLLQESDLDFSKLVIPFTKHQNEEIRVHAFYAMGKLKNKTDYLDCFIAGLADDSNRVICAVLQALSTVKNKKLLPYYRILAAKFPVEKDYVLANLNIRLAEYD